jgi:hypothetical protein
MLSHKPGRQPDVTQVRRSPNAGGPLYRRPFSHDGAEEIEISQVIPERVRLLSALFFSGPL